MVPGIFKPWTADITMIAVDYSLWEFEVWLPRTMRMEGVVAAGILKAPATCRWIYAYRDRVRHHGAEPRQAGGVLRIVPVK